MADPADLPIAHDTLTFEPVAAVPIEDIAFGVTSINVVSSGSGEGESGYTNPRNALDVNDDNQITPIDALLVINAANSLGSLDLKQYRGAGEGEAGKPAIGYVDVNADDFLTPMDALAVINHINAGGQTTALGEGELGAEPGEGEVALVVDVQQGGNSGTLLDGGDDGNAAYGRVADNGVQTDQAFASPSDVAFADWSGEDDGDESPVSDALIDDIFDAWYGLDGQV